MSSGQAKYYEEQEAQEFKNYYEKDLNFIKKVLDEIANIKPNTKEFKQLAWIYNNKDRILNNYKLIELLDKNLIF